MNKSNDMEIKLKNINKKILLFVFINNNKMVNSNMKKKSNELLFVLKE